MSRNVLIIAFMCIGILLMWIVDVLRQIRQRVEMAEMLDKIKGQMYRVSSIDQTLMSIVALGSETERFPWPELKHSPDDKIRAQMADERLGEEAS